MSEQILQDVKTYLGINPDVEDDTFDESIIMCINSGITELTALGVGEPGDFSLEEKTATWSDYLGDEYEYVKSLVKQFINIYTRIQFDYPTGSLGTALEEERRRLEFRIETTIEQHEEE